MRWSASTGRVQNASPLVLFSTQTVPRLEWNWPLTDARDRPGEVRWATHSFALSRDIAIALVDRQVAVGETVTVDHPLGTIQGQVTTIPFVDMND